MGHDLYIQIYKLQEEKGHGYKKLEWHALNMLVAGPVLWVLGSVHNSCQIYERADGHVQILQQSVYIPFLMGSLLFMVGSILNCHEQARYHHHGLDLLVSSSMEQCSCFFLSIELGTFRNPNPIGMSHKCWPGEQSTF